MIHTTVGQDLALIASAIFSSIYAFFRPPIFGSLTKKMLIKIFITSGICFLLANLILFTNNSIKMLIDLKNSFIGFHFLDFIAQISSLILVANFFSIVFILIPVIILYFIFCWLTGKLQDE